MIFSLEQKQTPLTEKDFLSRANQYDFAQESAVPPWFMEKTHAL